LRRPRPPATGPRSPVLRRAVPALRGARRGALDLRAGRPVEQPDRVQALPRPQDDVLRSRGRIVAVGGLVLAVLGAAALVSASLGLPDRDLAGGSGVPARRAKALPTARGGPQGAGPPGPVATQPPPGRNVGGLPAPPTSTVLPDGITPVTSSVTVGGMVRIYDVFSPPPGP